MSAPAAWPVHRLRITTTRLDLRPVTDADIDELLALAQDGIHADDEMPFLRPWTDAAPDQLAWDFCRYFWGQRATWAPDEWRLPLAVRVTGGALVGVQQLQADRFAEIGAVDTSSWLARRHQGRGIGTEMRAAALDLAFHGLGATRARSTALVTNPGSIGVSRKLGYRANGSEPEHVRGEVVENLRFSLDRATWLARAAETGAPARAQLDGLAGLEPLFGATPTTPAAVAAAPSALAGFRPTVAGDGAALVGAGAAPWLAAAGLR